MGMPIGTGDAAADHPEYVQSRDRLSLRGNFSWTLIGNAVYSGTQWGMLVALAKLANPETVGRFALAFAVTTPVIVFSNLQLRAVQATDARGDYAFGHYFALRIITSAIALLVIAGIIAVSGYTRQTSVVILAIGIAKTFDSLSDVFYGLAQQHERMDRVSISLLIRGPLSLAMLCILAYFTRSLEWGSFGLAGAWALVLVFYDIRTARLFLHQGTQHAGLEMYTGRAMADLRPVWDAARIAKLAVLSLPLGLTMLLISLNTNIPRYLIERYQGERQLGIYAAMTYLMVAGSLVVGSLGQSASPRLAQHFANGDANGFSRLMSKLLSIAVLMGVLGVVVAVFAGRWLFVVVYRPEYATQAGLFTWIAAAAGISYIQSFLGCGMTAAKCFKIQVPLLAVTTIIIGVTSFVLIPTHGLFGAVIAIMAATAAQTIGSLMVNIHALRHIKKR